MKVPFVFNRNLFALCGLLLLSTSATRATGQTKATPSKSSIVNQMRELPLHFEPTEDGHYVSRPGRNTITIDGNGSVQFLDPGQEPLQMSLVGAHGSSPAGETALPGHSNYFLGGDSSKWRHQVPQFARARVDSVYPGVDLVYYGNGSELEHDYIVHPGANAGDIQLSFTNGSATLESGTGDLLLQRKSGDAIRMRRPVAYQMAEDGTRQRVAASYRLRADGEVQFTLGNYDHARPMVIDPSIIYASYFSGNSNDSIVDMKLGSDNSLYLLLTTSSTNLTTKGAPSAACAGTCGPKNATVYTPDMYVAKLDPTWQNLIFATYLGGSNDDESVNLALDTNGNVYIAGFSHSSDFPVVNGYPGGVPTSSNSAGTLSKLSADGSMLLYSTFIGFGPSPEGANAPIMVTANNGIVYLIGVAKVTSDADFIWKTNPLFTAGSDFLAKLDTTKTAAASIVYATQVGDNITASYPAQLTSLALDSKGDVWLYGETTDTAFPVTTTGALQPQCKSKPCAASFLMEIDPTGTSAPYATYLGGSNGFQLTSHDIVIDASDNIYVSGDTDQTDYPIVNGAYSTSSSCTTYVDGSGTPHTTCNYASKLSSDGKTPLYSTFLPAYEIGVSAAGQLAFTGSYGAGLAVKNGLPTTPPASPHTDAMFGLIDTTQTGDSSLLISSYLGTNTGNTVPNRVLIASSGQILIVGSTGATDLPVKNAYQATCTDCTSVSGGGFIAATEPVGTLTLSSTSIAFPSTSVGLTSAAMTATLYNGTSNTITLTAGLLTDTTDFAESDNCNGSLTSGASCTLSFTFTPKSASSLNTVFTISDVNSPTLLSVSLTGTGTAAGKANTVTPSSVDFGSVALLTRATQVVTFTNNGASSLTLSPATISDPFGVFASDFNGTCTNNPVVPAGQSCTYELIFIPQAYQTYSGTFTVIDGTTNPTVTLTGTGEITTPQVTLTPNPLNFGGVVQGAVAQMNFTLTNGSSFPITFSDTVETITGPNAGDFSTQGVNFNECPIDYTNNNNVTIAPGASCQYTVSWSPNSSPDSSESATLTIPFSAPGSSFPYAVIATMTGTVISPAAAVISPTTLQFPATPAGKTSAVQTVTVTNTGEQPLGFTSAIPSGTNPANFAATNNCPASLGKNASCQIAVTFSPDASTNEFTAVLDVKTSTGDTNVTLNGGTSPSDFVLSSPKTSQGNPSPKWEIDVAPLTASIGFNEPITFTVTGLDASYGTPIFTPATVTPKGASVSTILTLGPVSPTAFNRRPGIGQRPTWPLFACLMLFLGLGTKFKSVRGRRILMVIACVTMGGLTLAACGNSPNPVTFTVTATSGSITHTIELTLQP